MLIKQNKHKREAPLKNLNDSLMLLCSHYPLCSRYCCCCWLHPPTLFQKTWTGDIITAIFRDVSLPSFLLPHLKLVSASAIFPIIKFWRLKGIKLLLLSEFSLLKDLPASCLWPSPNLLPLKLFLISHSISCSYASSNLASIFKIIPYTLSFWIVYVFFTCITAFLHQSWGSSYLNLLYQVLFWVKT